MTIQNRLQIVALILILPLIALACWLTFLVFGGLTQDEAKQRGIVPIEQLWAAIQPIEGTPTLIDVGAVFPSCAITGSTDRRGQALAAGRTAIKCIGAEAGILNSESHHIQTISQLAVNQLPDMIVRTHAIYATTERVAAKDALGHADMMAVLVGAGQFKAVADQVSAVTRNELTTELPEVSEELAAAGEALRKANGKIQGAASRLSRRMGEVSSGSELDTAEFRAAYEELTVAIDGLWKTSESELSATLDARVLADKVLLCALGIGLGLVLIAAVFVAWLFSRSILNSIHNLDRGIRDIADDDSNESALPDIDGRGEIAQIARAVRYFHERTVEKTAAKEREERAASEARQNEIDGLIESFQTRVTELLTLVDDRLGEMRETSVALGTMAEGADDSAQRVASSSAGASENVDAVALAADALATDIASISQQAHEATTTAQTATQSADAANAEIENLSNISASIGEIVSIIRAIAEQTNLLALNATIEAARAGEAGRGFEVVAGEVKALAGQTAEATEQITSQVTKVQEHTSLVVNAIQKIISDIGDVTNTTTVIATDLEERRASTDNIKENVALAAERTRSVVTDMSDVEKATQQSTLAASDVGEKTTEVVSQTEDLRREIQAFLQKVSAA